MDVERLPSGKFDTKEFFSWDDNKVTFTIDPSVIEGLPELEDKEQEGSSSSGYSIADLLQRIEELEEHVAALEGK